MPWYLFTARTSDGQQVTDRIESPTVESARYALELRHFSEIVFHTDDGSHDLAAWMHKETGVLDGPGQHARDELKSLRTGGSWEVLWSTWKANVWLWGPLLVWTLIGIRKGMPYSKTTWTALVLDALFLAYFAWSVLPGVAYQRLIWALFARARPHLEANREWELLERWRKALPAG